MLKPPSNGSLMNSFSKVSGIYAGPTDLLSCIRLGESFDLIF